MRRIAALLLLPALARAEGPPEPEEPPEGEVIEIVEETPPGSAHVVSEKELEKFEQDDVHDVLARIPGVYVRQEDGYGLRPNIGMRGSGSERSAKIALLEDGIPIAPAPYSAPAAYYFPLVTRMMAVEVLKGPASIRHGPNTVGGALNLVTRPVPHRFGAAIDLAGGSDFYGKLHGRVAEGNEQVGVMLEGVRLQSDGFKHIDGGGETGFAKDELLFKARAATSPLGEVRHEVEGKAGWADEVSHETYTGLSDADFAGDPYRRYAGTRLDRMSWQHLQLQVAHRLRVGEAVRVDTTAYRNTFSRDWRKLDAFAGRDLATILADPDAGANAVYYAVLTGAADSTSTEETLLVGTNARDFVSQGVQTIATWDRALFGLSHRLEGGLRLHYDRADRYHYDDGYLMIGGELMPDAAASQVSLDATGSALALSTYLRDTVRLGPVEVGAGLRVERVSLRWENHGDPSDDDRDAFTVIIPGGGAVWQVAPGLGLLAGVHKGYVPVSPGQDGGVSPEESVNFEAGARYATSWASVETIGFYSDYSNLKGTCTFSSGCRAEMIDEEFNGGAVHVWGVEAQATGEVPLGLGLHLPALVSYTFNHARFQHAFTSDNPQWGDVMAGDELPYLPPHQLTVEAGLAGARWQASAAARYTARMRDVAGQGYLPPEERTDPSLVFDLGGHVGFGAWGRAYLSVENLLDEANVVSRRPYGARPGSPRLVIVGYKNEY